MPTVKTLLLMWFIEIIEFDVDKNTRLINILFEQSAQFLNVTARGKYGYPYGVRWGAQIFQNSWSHLNLSVS